MKINVAACWMLIIITIATVTGKPVSTIRTHKRQSDQRVAELETLLALQKYGAHHQFLRAGGGDGSFSPGYGVIDFKKIGRKKKSSPESQPMDENNDWVLSSWASPNNDQSNEMMTSFRNRKRTWTASLQDSMNADNSPENIDSDSEK